MEINFFYLQLLTSILWPCKPVL